MANPIITLNFKPIVHDEAINRRLDESNDYFLKVLDFKKNVTNSNKIWFLLMHTGTERFLSLLGMVG